MLMFESLPDIIKNPIQLFFRPKSRYFPRHDELIDVFQEPFFFNLRIPVQVATCS